DIVDLIRPEVIEDGCQGVRLWGAGELRTYSQDLVDLAWSHPRECLGGVCRFHVGEPRKSPLHMNEYPSGLLRAHPIEQLCGASGKHSIQEGSCVGGVQEAE